MKFDFANILFSGPCNRSCPFCIGKSLPDAINRDNLSLFPLPGQEIFIQKILEYKIPNVVFTGTISDPQLYAYQAELLRELRARLHPEARFSLHTNGVLTLRQLDILHLYDKVCFSIPSLKAETYQRMMGSGLPPDLRKIVKETNIPIKVSCVVTSDNRPEIEEFLDELHEIGIRRVVLRNLFGDSTDWRLLADRKPSHYYRQNPVYDLDGMEVTVWSFERATSTSINLYPDGSVGESYLLTDGVSSQPQR